MPARPLMKVVDQKLPVVFAFKASNYFLDIFPYLLMICSAISGEPPCALWYTCTLIIGQIIVYRGRMPDF